MRDIGRLIAVEDHLLDRYEYDGDRPALLWLQPWDGAASLPRRGLHPYDIETCRRVRLTATEGIVGARRRQQQGHAGCHDQGRGGVTGDPWTPIQTGPDGGKALTVDGRGFNYRRLADIVAGSGYARAPLQEFGPQERGDGWRLVCRALARGQGKTEKHHERTVPIPAPAIDFLHTGEGYERLADIAERRVANAATVRSALRYALMTLFQNGPDRADYSPQDSSSARRAGLSSIGSMTISTPTSSRGCSNGSPIVVLQDNSEIAGAVRSTPQNTLRNRGRLLPVRQQSFARARLEIGRAFQACPRM